MQEIAVNGTADADRVCRAGLYWLCNFGDQAKTGRDVNMQTEQCKDCPWPLLAQARDDLLNARARKDGRTAMRIKDIISNLEEKIKIEESLKILDPANKVK